MPIYTDLIKEATTKTKVIYSPWLRLPYWNPHIARCLARGENPDFIPLEKSSDTVTYEIIVKAIQDGRYGKIDTNAPTESVEFYILGQLRYQINI